jgi:acyl dehydratase
MRERGPPESKENHAVSLVPPVSGLLHHEDLEIGAQQTFAPHAVTREAIIDFPRQFDPQTMHLDEEAAKKTIVGGLCASGFHTCAILMRQLCDNFLLRTASLGSPGIDEVKWLRPVRPQDQLALRIGVLEKRNLQSRPDVGLSKMLFELLDSHGNVVLSMLTNQLLRRRRPGAPLAVGERQQKPVANHGANLWDEASTPQMATQGNFFEDQVVGEVRDLGAHTFERDDIIAFAKQFDPQPFHIDEQAGRASLFKGLAASGWHTASIFIRQVVVARQAHEAALRASGQRLAAWGPSPGFRNLNWPRPVLAGDRIEFRQKTIEARGLKSRPRSGLLISQAEGRNQRGEIVYGFIGQVLIERRTT